MAIPYRVLLLAAASLTAALMFATVEAGSADAAPRAFAQKNVKPGKMVNVRVKNFPRRSKATLFLQPTKYRGGNGFGIALKRRVWIPRGTKKFRFRMTKRYFACAGARDCNTRKWQKNSRVDITVCTVNKRIPYCAIAVTRVR